MTREMKILSVRVPEELLAIFEKKVKREHLRVPDVIRTLIAKYVRESNGEEKEDSE